MRSQRIGLASLLLLLTWAAGCGQPPDAPPPATERTSARQAAEGAAVTGPWFRNEASARGVSFRHRSGHDQLYLMPETVGSGAALFDMEGDGDLDLYLVQSGSLVDPVARQPGNALYENVGGGQFVDVSATSGAADRGYGMGVACGDYDNDGDVDLYLTNYGANVLLRNEGGRFTDVTSEAGVEQSDWGTSAAFLDFDRDGDLDLFVVNYIRWAVRDEMDCYNFLNQSDFCPPTFYESPVADSFFRNEGDGTFTDVSTEMGLTSHAASGLGVVCGDYDGDGWLDVFVANDSMANHLWLNQGGKSFVESALGAGCAVDAEGFAKAGMGVVSTDIDTDGDLDLIVTNLQAETNSYFRNEGGVFADSTARVGLAGHTRPWTGFGLGAIDFDADGWLDLLQANGRVARQHRVHAEDVYAEPDLLFRGGKDGRFGLVPSKDSFGQLVPRSGRGAAFGDVDGDGRVDAVIANNGAPPFLLLNARQDRGHWLLLRVLSKEGRDALGATVLLTVDGRRLRREVQPAFSYLSSSDPRVHVGLGGADRAEDVKVRWVDGSTEAFGTLAADRSWTLSQGTATPR